MKLQMMHGKIWVIHSSHGSTQSMGLVLRFQVRPSIAITITEAGESSEQPHSNSLFKGLQVLLADNDDLNRAVTRKLLEKLGCIVSTVSSGFDCLSAIGPAASPFQIVILDLQMPEMDGYEVASRIRKYRSRSWPLIIATTASADEGVWEKCTQIGINGVITKPVLLQGLAMELRRALIQANKVMWWHWTAAAWNLLSQFWFFIGLVRFCFQHRDVTHTTFKMKMVYKVPLTFFYTSICLIFTLIALMVPHSPNLITTVFLINLVICLVKTTMSKLWVLNTVCRVIRKPNEETKPREHFMDYANCIF